MSVKVAQKSQQDYLPFIGGDYFPLVGDGGDYFPLIGDGDYFPL